MKYFSKILLILFIFIFICLPVCSTIHAENVTQTTETTQSSGQISTVVKSSDSADNELFSPSNIINILLIAVGIVLILLAIAIFTRLK